MPTARVPTSGIAPEVALRESEAQLRAVFEHSRDALLLLDSSGACLRANPAATELLGLGRDDSGGIALQQLVPLTSGGGNGRVQLKAGDGQPRHVEYSVCPDVLPGRHLLVLRDVTDRDLLERQFYQAQKMETVGQLAGGIAHDFNNILTAVVGFGTLLYEQVQHDEAASRNAKEILDAAQRASTLTRQLLAFGRRQVLCPVRLNLNDTVSNLAGMLRRVIGEDINLQIVCDPGLPVVRADQGQLESALMNLVVNARDAMPGGGRLLIETSADFLDEAYCGSHVTVRPGHYVRLAVSDTGVGISAEQQARVFDPFYSTKDVAKGSGLGLATVYGIVKQSDGYIWVYSERGVGTTFKIYLPVDRADRPSTRPAHSPLEWTRGTETILLVEDADIIRHLAREIVGRAGYRVLEAADADEAMKMASRHIGVIDLLLTDVIMPGASGVDLAVRLRQIRPDVPVLYMSGYTDNATVRNGLLSEGASFLQKPFTPESLLRKIRQALEAAAV
jgi:nitrogen-specific signal transduction histidine kinase/ActR/RegA family two-component response regulator